MIVINASKSVHNHSISAGSTRIVLIPFSQRILGRCSLTRTNSTHYLAWIRYFVPVWYLGPERTVASHGGHDQ